MYRRRRLAALLLALVVVAGIAALVLALWQPWRSPDPAPTAPAAATSPADSASPATATATGPATDAATESAAAEPSAAPEPDPSASGSEAPIAACSTSGISVLAVTDKDSYAAGELPQLSITLSNTSSRPCLINVGTATQSFEITSGSDTWWRSTDCQSESSDQVVQLAAGQTVSSVTPVVWDRTRSSVDTCGSARPQAPAGYFHLQVSIGGIQAADTGMFELR